MSAVKLNTHRALLLVAIVLAGVIGVNAQQNSANLPRMRAINYRGDLANLLASLVLNDTVIIGMETDPIKPNSEIAINLQYVTLRDVLNSIIELEPRYTWRESSGSFDLFPVGGGVGLLDASVNYFEVKDVTGNEALDQLLALPEIQAILRSMKLNRKPVKATPERSTPPKFSLTLSGVTLRQAFNSIAKASGKRFWLFRSYPDKSFTIALSPGD